MLDTIERDGLLDNVKQVGAKLADGLDSIDHTLVAGCAGPGSGRPSRSREPAAWAVEAAARQSGFLVNAVQPDAIRLAPPLILRRTSRVIRGRAARDPRAGRPR